MLSPLDDFHKIADANKLSPLPIALNRYKPPTIAESPGWPHSVAETTGWPHRRVVAPETAADKLG